MVARARVLLHVAVRAAVVFVEDRDGAERGGVVAEPDVRGLHPPGEGIHRVGRRSGERPNVSAALVLALDGPHHLLADRHGLCGRAFLQPVHELERHSEPVRTARLPAARPGVDPTNPPRPNAIHTV